MRTSRWTMIVLAGALALAACTGGEDAAGTGNDGGEGAVQDEGAFEPDTDRAGDGEEVAEGGDDAVTGAGSSAALAGRQVIQRVDLALESDDPVATIDAVTAAARRAGGFVADSNLRREEGILQGSLTLRVPTDRLDATLTDIEQAGAEVVSRQLSSDDVTGEYADIEAQLRNLRALETELLALLEEAREEGGTTDVLTVFDRIRATRGEIEQLEGRQAVLDDLVALATVQVTVRPTEMLLSTLQEELQEDPSPWSPGDQLDAAWDATVAVLQGVGNAAIWLAATVLPLVLVLLGPPALIVWVVVRRRRRRRPPTGPSAGVPAPPTGVPSSSAPNPEG